MQQEKQALESKWNAARSNFAANPYGGAQSNWQAWLARLQELNSAIARCGNFAPQQESQPQAVDTGRPAIIGTPYDIGTPATNSLPGPSSNDSWTNQTVNPALAMGVANALAELNRELAKVEGMIQMLPKGASLSDVLATPEVQQSVPQPPPDYVDPSLQKLRQLANEPSGAVAAPSTGAPVTSTAPVSSQGFDQSQLNNLRNNVGGLSAGSGPPTTNTSAAPTMPQQPQANGYQTCVGTFANQSSSFCEMGNYIYFQNGTSLKIK